MRALRIPELVITAEPKPSEVQYLEDRIPLQQNPHEWDASPIEVAGNWRTVYASNENEWTFNNMHP